MKKVIEYMHGHVHVLTYILILVLLQLFRMLKECQLIHFTGYRTAHFYNLLMYIIIIQKILEKNKNINVIKKKISDP